MFAHRQLNSRRTTPRKLTPFRFVHPAGGVTAPATYERTAFVDPAAGSTPGELNNPALPYGSFGSAVIALIDAYHNEATTIRLMADVAADADDGQMSLVMLSGLTIMSHDATVRNITGTLSFGYENICHLNLSKVTIANLVKVPHATANTESAGTITGDGYTTIQNLILDSSADPGAPGENGSGYLPGDSLIGGNGADGVDGNPPTAGGDAPDFVVDGTDAYPGYEGHRGWDVTLLGSGLYSVISTQSSSVGGTGGNGGSPPGSSATGGVGGVGGDSTALALQNGGAGGAGAWVFASAGLGGTGGLGGSGGSVFHAVGCMISTSYLTGAAGGAGGVAGTLGGANTAGSGGAGGSGVLGGAAGAAGATGNVVANAGYDGSAGSDGTPGALIPL